MMNPLMNPIQTAVDLWNASGTRVYDRFALWTPTLVKLHMIGDLTIWIAYLIIPLVLLAFTRRRPDLPFPWMFWMFAMFIVGCGFTHFFEVYSIFWPRLWLSAAVKLFTAVVSFATIIALFPTMKLALELRSPTQLEAVVRERTAELAEANASLQVEIAERQATQEALRTAHDGLELRVRERTADLVRVNETLRKEADDRIQAEGALRLSEERFRTLVESVKDYAIFMLDPEGYVTSWNAGAERIKGYRPEEILGAHFSSFYTAEDIACGVPAYALAMAAADGRFETEGWRVRKDGSQFWVNVVITALRDSAGRLRGYAKVSRDFTERRRTQEELKTFAARLQRSNRALEEFALVASHDLQEPLRKIRSFSDRLLSTSTDALGAQGRDSVARIQAATARMRRLIDDLLNYSRVTMKANPFTPTDLGQVVREVVSDLEARIQQTGARVNVRDLPAIDADPSQMRQLFQNLIGNALKFQCGDTAPEVEVGAELIPGPGSGTETCRISVRDNGIGFDEQYIDRIFNVFERLHGRSEFEGTGIGLAICRKIVERHGGTISARSVPGQGATFLVSLPVRHAEAENAS